MRSGCLHCSFSVVWLLQWHLSCVQAGLWLGLLCLLHMALSGICHLRSNPPRPVPLLCCASQQGPDDEVVLQCTATIHKEQQKLCLAAEGFGNRLCFLESTSNSKQSGCSELRAASRTCSEEPTTQAEGPEVLRADLSRPVTLGGQARRPTYACCRILLCAAAAARAWTQTS
ncbi:Hypothetical predicted protein [Marmota monax]|uniref:Inositol 1,4,5-trisphosphate/ryanodine receptor domain-containing protein n=1 Tax=Marmota monax TaxID=9995 RepID=A0A5E4B3H0_MARMO|nr:Hypothetical predicted protein [Marmota monax]